MQGVERPQLTFAGFSRFGGHVSSLLLFPWNRYTFPVKCKRTILREAVEFLFKFLIQLCGTIKKREEIQLAKGQIFKQKPINDIFLSIST